MKTENPRPKIKVRLTTADWLLEIAAALFLVALFALPAALISSLPPSIPTHFNAAGIPDGSGSRTALWFLPFTGLFLYLLTTIVSFYPHVYNYPVEVTVENAAVQYRIATRLIRALKSVILIVFLFLTFKTIQVAYGKSEGLGKAFLPVFLATTLLLIVFYVRKALINRHPE